MLKRSKIIYFLLLILLLIGNIIFLILDKCNINSFYFLTSSLHIIFPFISLFYILFLNIKKIEYKTRKYDESSLITYIIFGSLWLFIYNKISTYIPLYVAYIISILAFIIISIIFLYLNIKKGEIKEEPKIIRNK